MISLKTSQLNVCFFVPFKASSAIVKVFPHIIWFHQAEELNVGTNNLHRFFQLFILLWCKARPIICFHIKCKSERNAKNENSTNWRLNKVFKYTLKHYRSLDPFVCFEKFLNRTKEIGDKF